MNPCAHHHPVDDLAAYASDAIDDPAEIRAIRGHLALCPGCRAQLAAHERALAALVEDEAPPASLWAGIAARVAGSVPRPVVVVTAQVAPPEPPPLRLVGAPRSPRRAAPATATPLSPPPAGPAAAARPGPGSGRRHRHRGHRRPRRLGTVAAAAALVAAAAAVPFGVAAWQRADRPAGPSLAAGRTIAVLADRTGEDRARVVERPDGTYVMLDHLATLPAGRTYQLWSLDGARPASLGLLGRGSDTAVRVTLPPGTARVAISDEPAGGSPAPTTMIAGVGRMARPA